MNSRDAVKPDKTPPIRKSFFWAALGQAAHFTLQFGSSVTLARLLSPYELGIFAIALATVGMITAAQSFGLNNYLIRAERLDHAVISSVFTINMTASAVLAAAIVSLGAYGQYLFKDPGVKSVLMWLAWTPMIAALALIPTSLLQREGNFRTLSLLRIASSALGTICTVIFAFAGLSYMSLAYGQTIAAVVYTLAICLVARRFVHFSFGIQEWRTIMQFGVRMLAINGVVQLQRQISNFSLGNLRGLAALGFYSRANNLYNLLSDNIHTVIVRVILVDFAAVARSDVPLRARYLKVLEFMTALLWPAFAGMAVLAGPLVHNLYGPKWNDLALPLSLLCMNGILWVSVTMAWELFVVANETARQARFEFIRSAVGLTLFVAGCFYSLNAAVLGRVGEGVFAVFLYRPHIMRMTQSKPEDFRPIYARSALLTLVAITPATCLMLYTNWDPKTSVLLIGGAVLLGGVLWGLALLLLNHPILDEVKRFTSKRRVRAKP